MKQTPNHQHQPDQTHNEKVRFNPELIEDIRAAILAMFIAAGMHGYLQLQQNGNSTSAKIIRSFMQTSHDIDKGFRQLPDGI